MVEADLLRLTRDYDALSKNYQELVQRRETANLAKQMDTQTRRVEFRVVEPPVVPLRPSSPWRGPLIAVAALAGLAAGIALAVLRLTLQRQVTRPEQLLNAFDIPIAGVVRQIISPSGFGWASARCCHGMSGSGGVYRRYGRYALSQFGSAAEAGRHADGRSRRSVGRRANRSGLGRMSRRAAPSRRRAAESRVMSLIERAVHERRRPATATAAIGARPPSVGNLIRPRVQTPPDHRSEISNDPRRAG